MEYQVLFPEAVIFEADRVNTEFRRAVRTMAQYDLRPRAYGLVQGNDKAFVWRIETDDGPKALKWIGRKAEKAKFSIYAHHHLQAKGFPVPSISRTKTGRLFLQDGQRVGFVAQWIIGRPINPHAPGDWAIFCKALADFHNASRGLRLPPGTRIKSKLGGWPLDYQSKISRLKLWYQVAQKKRGFFYSRYRELAPRVIAHAEKLLEQLVRSAYWDWIEAEIAGGHPPLCHSDYGLSNTVLAGNTLYVIDMDTCTHDLPIRDMRKLFETFLGETTALDEGLRQVIEGYTKHRPLSMEQLGVFLIDVQFPYKFFQAAKDGFTLNLFDEATLVEAAQNDLARSRAVALVSKKLKPKREPGPDPDTE